MRIQWFLIFLIFATAGCQGGFQGTPTRVSLVASIHGNHLLKEGYNLSIFEKIIREIKPEVVLAEIPPDRFGPAWNQFVKEDTVTEAYVSRFPEFTEVIFRLKDELKFQIYPVSGWTYEYGADEGGVLKRISNDPIRQEEWDEYRTFNEKMIAAVEAGGGQGNPVWVHSPGYDSAVRIWSDNYERLFGAELDNASWTSLNNLHYGLISAQLDSLKGSGKSVAIVFGAGNRGILEEKLRQRDDIVLTDMVKLVEKVVGK